MILVCGEALFDLFLADEHANGFTLDARFGGSPFNVAIGLQRLAQPSALLTGLSTDWLGERLLNALAKEGVNTDYLARFDRPTTISLVGLDQSGSPSYAFYGQEAADRALTPAELPSAEQLAAIKAIHIGSYSTAVAPISDTLDQLIKATDCFVSYDPNIRPTVEPNIDHWRARVEAIVPQVDLLKISSEDLETLYPEHPPAEVAKRWLAAGVSLVVITHGGEGAHGYSQNASASCSGQKVTVVDTVGAGDSFQAALLTALAERSQLSKAALASLSAEQIESLLRFATEVAAIVVSRRGADIPFRSELGSSE